MDKENKTVSHHATKQENKNNKDIKKNRGSDSALGQKLVIAISSRALFDLDASNAIYEQDGVTAYAKYQIEHENDPLLPGVAFPLVKKLLKLNQYGEYVEVILLSRNSADTGLRVFNSIQHYNLGITRAAFTSGISPHGYAAAFHAHLFLSANPEDVRNALNENCAAATVLPSRAEYINEEQVRIAFDGDAVIFSDEAERVFQEKGLAAFNASEQRAAQQPLGYGPLHSFLAALHNLQKKLPQEKHLIRTALITSRSAPTHERVIRTFRSWNIRIDEALFLGGLSKGDFLQTFHADIFFDDQTIHCTSANNNHVTTGHVPHGCKNNRH
jgi:5'-nucleotidase